MYTTNLTKIVLSVSIASLIFVGCGGGSSSSDTIDTPDVPDTTVTINGVIVDPYIAGAVLCEDVDKNAVCGAAEQLSSASTSEGAFSFDKALTAGSHVIVQKQGTHEGKTYDLNISGVVAADGSIDVVSPLTTFETKGLTTTQIAEILNNAATDAGLTGWTITANDISGDPMAGGLANKTISQLSDDDLVNIQASLASYGILKIMSGSHALNDLNSTELYNSGMQMNGHEELYLITKSMLNGISNALNKNILTNIKSGIDAGRSALVAGGQGYISQATAGAGLPEPTADLIIKVAVSVIDRLAQIGYAECNSSGGDVTAALAAVTNNQTAISNQAVALGTQMYGLTYASDMKNSLSAYPGALSGIFAAESSLETGYDAKEAGYTTIRFDDSNNLVAQ